MKKFFWFLSGIALLGLCYLWGGAVLAQPTSTARPDSRPEIIRRTGDITIRNRGRAVYIRPKGLARMWDNVRVTQEGEDFILYADELTYNENTNQAVATKNLKIESRDSTIKGDKIFADFDTKVITIQGHVVMASHGEKDGIKSSAPRAGDKAKAGDKRSLRDELRHKPSRLTCDRIDYNYQNRQAVVTGSIRLTQDDNKGTCDRILFDEAKNVAQLFGNVVFHNGDRQTMKSSKIIVWIDEDKVGSDKPITIEVPDNRKPSRTPAPPQPKVDVPPAPAIPEDILAEFPTPVPLPTDAPAAEETAEDEKTAE
ncbi:MAG TPA: LPS export ABC transporter periplasmic protein LptC [Abditibacteriaceae bacterium]|nr:LPS export ABC transporter periplasmic protein LptC [Abditibacteriaceae bacterium]